MITRIISSLVAIVLGITIILIDYKWLYIAIITIFSLMGAYELLSATKYIKNKAVAALSFSFVIASPFMYAWKPIRENISVLCFGLLMTMFVIMLISQNKKFKPEHRVDFQEVCTVSSISICIPLSLICLWLMRDKYDSHGVFCIVYTLVMTFMNDAGAYFIGSAFGKRKLAPEISPKKTLEGFIGGLAFSAVSGIVFAFAYEFLHPDVRVDKIALAVYGVVIALFGVLGDLSASSVKRTLAIKDFGDIMPGHGGFLDRFDSVLFTAPLVYNLFAFWFPIG